MEKKTNAVRLLRTDKYTTYQFYGEMANKNTNVEDGLRYAILTTFEWLRTRFENAPVPKELNMPGKEEYRKVKDDLFQSFTISDSYRMSVVSDVKEGIWALRISEPDSGQLQENKIPVQGRTIQSDIGYRIVDGKLECGFKTMIYDSADVEKAGCVRFSLIKTLGDNPIFGFKHLTNLSDTSLREISDENSFENLKYLLGSKENELPFIIYTDNIPKLNEEDIRKQMSSIFSKAPSVLLEAQKNTKSLERDQGHLNNASSKYYGIARVFFVHNDYFTKVAGLLNKASIQCEEVITVDARKHGGQSKKYSHDDKRYKDYLFNYTREKNVDFHDVLFVDEASILIRNKKEEEYKEHQRLLDEKSSTIDQLQSRKEKEERLAAYQPVDDRDKEAIEELQKSIKELENERDVLSREKKRLENENTKKNNYISFLERRLKWPKKHADIVDWCSDYQYVEFNTKAVDCLKDSSAANVDIDVIMNALEYLEFAYGKYIFNEIDGDELQKLSDEIYGRPYNVSPSGIPASARSDCKIRYSFNGEKKKEIPLDQHLKIGGHGDILRIYFIVDKNRKKIVIGSLPNHLIY